MMKEGSKKASEERYEERVDKNDNKAHNTQETQPHMLSGIRKSKKGKNPRYQKNLAHGMWVEPKNSTTTRVPLTPLGYSNIRKP
jgi:hypothetical protein